MNNVTFNSLAKMLDDVSFNNEVLSLLNELIDIELEKADYEIDFDFIDECSAAIIEIESNGALNSENVLSLFSSNSFVEKTQKVNLKKLSFTMKVAIIAAVLLISTITVNAAVREVTGQSVLEQIGIINTKEDETEATSQATQIETTIEKSTEKNNISQGDDSKEIVIEKNKSANDSYVIKSSQYSDNLSPGASISYKKKGDSIKLTETFTDKDDFDEKQFLINEYGNIGVDYCDTGDGSRVKHKFSNWEITKSSTCKERGEKTRICTLCGEEQKCPIPKEEKHDCKLHTVLEPASYEKSGRYSYICKTCGKLFERKQPKADQIIISQDVFYYNGQTQKPKVIAVLDKEGNEIPKENYKVSYKSGSSKNVHLEYAVIINFNSQYYEDAFATNYYIRPMANNIDGISSLKNGFNVYWKKNSLSNSDNTSGYEIEYSLNQDFSNSTKVKAKGMNTLSKMVTNLDSGKTYYVRMRVYFYDEISMVNVYSYWSDIRAIKTK